MNDETKILEVLKLLYDEWKFRLSNLWSLVIKANTFAFALIIFPLLYEKLGIRIVSINIPMDILPITGMALSAAIFIFSHAEMQKIQKIKKSVRENMKDLSPQFKLVLNKGNPLNQHIP